MQVRTPTARGRRSVPALVVFLAVCAFAQFAGWSLTNPSIRSGWYRSLRKPPWTPPDWVFGPAWTFIFLTMAVAAWFVWTRRDAARIGWPLAFFSCQLVLNVLWSGAFFAAQQPGWALADIVLLWAAVLLTLTAFWRVHTAAGALIVPYLAWLTYAAALNYSIWRLNP